MGYEKAFLLTFIFTPSLILGIVMFGQGTTFAIVGVGFILFLISKYIQNKISVYKTVEDEH